MKLLTKCFAIICLLSFSNSGTTGGTIDPCAGTVCIGSEPLQELTDVKVMEVMHNNIGQSVKAFHVDPSMNSDTLKVTEYDGVSGNVEYDKQSDTLYISFRGTPGVFSQMFVEDLRDQLVTGEFPCGDCATHLGLTMQYNKIRLWVLIDFDQMAKQYPGAKVVVTGFSAAGVFASYFAVDIALRGFKPNLMTFGSIRPGDQKFVDFANGLLVDGYNWRVINNSDVAVTWSAYGLGNRHMGQPIYLAGDAGTPYVGTTADRSGQNWSYSDHNKETYQTKIDTIYYDTLLEYSNIDYLGLGLNNIDYNLKYIPGADLFKNGDLGIIFSAGGIEYKLVKEGYGLNNISFKPVYQSNWLLSTPKIQIPTIGLKFRDLVTYQGSDRVLNFETIPKIDIVDSLSKLVGIGVKLPGFESTFCFTCSSPQFAGITSKVDVGSWINNISLNINPSKLAGVTLQDPNGEYKVSGLILEQIENSNAFNAVFYQQKGSDIVLSKGRSISDSFMDFFYNAMVLLKQFGTDMTPSFSLDLVTYTPKPIYAKKYYPVQIQDAIINTALGNALFVVDYLIKKWAVGYISDAEKALGIQSIDFSIPIKETIRFWITPDNLDTFDQGKQLKFDNVKFKIVCVQYTLSDPNNPQSSTVTEGPPPLWGQKYVDSINAAIPNLLEHHPDWIRLKEVYLAFYSAKFVLRNNMNVNWDVINSASNLANSKLTATDKLSQVDGFVNTQYNVQGGVLFYQNSDLFNYLNVQDQDTIFKLYKSSYLLSKSVNSTDQLSLVQEKRINLRIVVAKVSFSIITSDSPFFNLPYEIFFNAPESQSFNDIATKLKLAKKGNTNIPFLNYFPSKTQSLSEAQIYVAISNVLLDNDGMDKPIKDFNLSPTSDIKIAIQFSSDTSFINTGFPNIEKVTCYPSCKACFSAGDINTMHCMQCNDTYFPLSDNLMQCYQDTDPLRPQNYALMDDVLIKCYKSCATCKNSAPGIDSQHNCNSCAIGYYPLSDNTSLCYTNEDTNKPKNYTLDLDNKKFAKCFESCDTCSLGSNSISHNCSRCAAGFYSLPDQTTQCYTPDNKPANYLFINGSFVKCNDACAKCTAPADATNHNCSICATEYYSIVNDLTHCYKPDNIIVKNYVVINNVYQKCFDSCATCFNTGSPTAMNCDICAIDHYPLEDNKGQCFAKSDANLPQNYFFDISKFTKCYSSCGKCSKAGDSTNHNCSACLPNFYSLADNLTQCFASGSGPKNYILINNRWEKCYTGCANCSAVGDLAKQNCLTCADTYFALEDNKTKCFKQDDAINIPGGYFFNTNIFTKCYTTCAKCSAIGNAQKHNCLTCLDNTYPLAGDKTQCFSRLDPNLPAGLKFDCVNNYFIESTCYTSCKTCPCIGNAYDHKCTACADGFYPLSDRINMCYNLTDTTRPRNYILTSNVFKKCHESCNDCSAPPSINARNCLTCATNYYPLVDISSDCYTKVESTRPTNYYFRIDVARFDKCYYSCSTCTQGGDPDKHNCSTCTADFYPLEADITKCYTKADPLLPAGLALDPASLKFKPLLTNCHSRCSSCVTLGSDSNHQCVTCAIGYFPADGAPGMCFNSQDTDSVSQYYLAYNVYKKCYSSCKTCSSGFDATSNKHNCKVCAASYYPTALDKTNCFISLLGYYLKNNELVECPNGCKECSGEFTCTSCKSGYLYDYTNSKCVQSCPLGFYPDNNNCVPCNASCKECHNASSCWTCNSKYYSYGFGQLCGPCMDGCLSCTNNYSCTSCVPGRYLSGAKCLESCPDGFYKDDNQNTCNQCNSPCKNCSSNNLCKDCIIGYNLDTNNQCIKIQCSDNQYLDTTKNLCTDCPSNCATCSSTYQCNSCKDGFILNSGECVKECPDGTWNDRDSKTCKSCSKMCKLCTNSSDFCKTCADDLYGQTQTQGVDGITIQCVTKCPDNTYPEVTTKLCKTCQELNKVIYKGDCINECPSGYTADPNRTCVESTAQVNPCDKDPCKNGGTCQNTLADFSCTCTSSYSGKYCEKKLDLSDTQQLEDDEAPEVCSLVASAMDLIKNPCFNKIQSIIACLSPCEQELWVTAYNNNKDTDKCFDCSTMNKESLKACNVKNINSIAEKALSNYSHLRKSLSCLKGFQEDIFNTQIGNIVSQQNTSSQCFKNLLSTIANVNIRRKKFLCATNAQISANTLSTDSTGQILQFKYTSEDANQLVSSFTSYADCKANLTSTVTSAIFTITEQAINSTECAVPVVGTRLLEDTTTIKTVTQNVPMKGYSLASDVNDIFDALVTEASDFPELTNALKAGKASIADGVVCDPSVIPLLFSNIQQTEENQKNNIKNIYEFTRSIIPCDVQSGHAIYVISVSNNSIKCTGACPEGLTNISFKWVSESNAPPSSYSIFAGCLKGAKYFYASITNSKAQNIIQLRYNKGNTKFDLASQCQQKSKECLPGSDKATESNCPQNKLNEDCMNSLNQKCKASGLAQLLQNLVPDSAATKPPACQSVDLSLQVTAKASREVINCLQFINNNVVKGLSTDIAKVADLDNQVLSSANVITSSLRYLQSVSDFINDDVSLLPDYFREIATISETDVSVNLNRNAASDFNNYSSGKYVNANVLILALILLFLVIV
jgi:hypothetical protein